MSSLLWHVINIIIWLIYESTSRTTDKSIANDKNNLWVLHGVYFVSLILAVFSLIFVQKFNSDLVDGNDIKDKAKDKDETDTILQSIKISTQQIGHTLSRNAKRGWKQLWYDVMSLRTGETNHL